MRELEERRAPRWVKSTLSIGTVALLATGFFVGVVLRSVLVGVLLFALQRYAVVLDLGLIGCLVQYRGCRGPLLILTESR